MVRKKLSSRRRRNYRLPLIIIGIVILCVGGGVAFAMLTGSADTSSDDEIVAPGENSESPATETEKDTETDNFNEVPQYDGEDPNALHELTGVITYAAVNGENLSIRVSINQTLGSGTCKLTLASDTASYTSGAPITQSGATTSSCEGFDVPLSELGDGAGETAWNISVAVESDGKTGLITGSVAP